MRERILCAPIKSPAMVFDHSALMTSSKRRGRNQKRELASVPARKAFASLLFPITFDSAYK